MAEGSRPISKQYEGQRVSAVPDGFLQAYAQVGANIQGAGKAIGEGIGGAIAAYKENQQKHEIADGTAKAQFAAVGGINSYLDAKIKATPDAVKGKATDPNTTDPDAISYRALIDAKDTLTKDISGWTDKSLTGKTAALGRIAILNKFSEDWKDEETKKAAAITANQHFELTHGLKVGDSKLVYDKWRASTAGQRGTEALSQALDTIPIATEGGPSIALNPAFENAFKIARSQIADALKKVPITDKETINILTQKARDLNERYTQASTQASGVEEQAKSTTATVAAALRDPTEAKKHLVEIDTKIADLTAGRGGIELAPKAVQEEVKWLQEEKDNLSSAIAKAEKSGKDWLGGKALVDYQPTTIRQRLARQLNAQNSAQIWEASMKEQDLPVTPVAKEYVRDIAMYHGETTSDGWKITVDSKTGGIKRERDPDFVRWYKAKANGENLTGEELANFEKAEADSASRAMKISTQTLGVRTPDGLTPSLEIHDRHTGANNVYVRGQMLLDSAESMKVRKEIGDQNALMNSLGNLRSLLSARSADGKTIEYKKVTRPSTAEEKEAGKGETITEDAMKDGYRVPVLRKLSDLSMQEKQQFTTAVATFIRIKAKGLGVLSKTDWDYLRTLAPDLGPQFSENFNLKEDSAIKTVAQAMLSSLTIKSEDFVSRIDQQMTDINQNMRVYLAGIPAKGTASGRLEVTGGAAMRVNGERLYGQDLSNWWDMVSAAKTDGQTYSNDWNDMRSDISTALVNRTRPSGPQSGPAYYQQKYDELTAFLAHKGLDTAQQQFILKKYKH